MIVAGTYAGPLGHAIRRLKYASRADLAAPLAKVLALRLREAERIAAPLCWVPVPLHPKRLAERGFNQSALVARGLAGELGGRFEPRLLARLRDTTQQASLERDARRENVRAAFVVRRPARFPIALVDDVVTTGATLGACVEALERAGARVAMAVAIAHAT